MPPGISIELFIVASEREIRKWSFQSGHILFLRKIRCALVRGETDNYCLENCRRIKKVTPWEEGHQEHLKCAANSPPGSENAGLADLWLCSAHASGFGTCCFSSFTDLFLGPHTLPFPQHTFLVPHLTSIFCQAISNVQWGYEGPSLSPKFWFSFPSVCQWLSGIQWAGCHGSVYHIVF